MTFRYMCFEFLFLLAECVLKLPTNDSGGETESTSSLGGASSAQDSAQGSQQAGVSKQRKAGKKDQQEAPPGYVQSLVNKIISNVKGGNFDAVSVFIPSLISKKDYPKNIL